MYHHPSQQPGQQPFSNGARPPHHQPPPNQQQNRSSSDMMGFQFPRPTQLPDELESALAIRGARDMDHRLIDHMSRSNQHQNQGSGSGISQHGSYGSNPIALTSDNQPGHQQGVDWSSYQPPTKLFASPPPSASHQSQLHQGPQQQPQTSHAGTSSWTAPVSASTLPQARPPHGGGDGQGLYTPESAGSILASFGLSNEDLEVLSHYPDDQLTPDTLPFILRDIQINKSGNQKTVSSTSSSSFARNVHDGPLPPTRSSPLARSCSPTVPSLLTVTQTAGKVIDYGHASRAKDDSSTRETFKREQLSSERTVKMYPSSPLSSSAPKADKAERRQVRLEHTEPSKHGDRDYRRTSTDHRKSNRSPGREFPLPSKSRNLDRDYRHDGPKPRPPSETRSEASSRRSVSSSSGSKPHSSSKKLPTPTMISDFSAVSPKVYPHTCSLCHIQCDQEKDWVDHVNTVNHTAACRDLRNKYPDWKPNLPSRSGRYGSRALWDPKDRSPSHSLSRSLSCSLSPSPPHSRHRVGPHLHRPHRRPYSPHHQPRHQHYRGGFSHSGVKRPYDDLAKFSPDTSRHPSSSKAGHGSKQRPLQATKTMKSGTKPGTKMTKTASAKAADTSAKPPPAKKKKKVVTPASQDSSVADRLVYLTGIPKDASEQEVTDLVRSFGKINNVILMPCSEEESEKGEGQKASVCMVKAEDAQALANSANLSIRDQQITASVAKKPEAVQSSDANNSKPAPGQDKGAADSGGEADQKTSEEKGMLLITGLPESGWSESDIIKLVQTFGTPSDIILAPQIGKVLVSVPDTEIAQEIVKVHTFIPAKIKDSELKMTHLKQCIGLSTPVALYNLLMGSADPLESPVPVSWSSLLVISNVPNTPSASSEVQNLVRRFGTVIKTLVLNNTVICEMATAAMALSVYKRFQTFPCIIQNNPLFFSRKPDPKTSTQTKVITAYLDSSEETPASCKGSASEPAAAAAGEEETAQKDDSESPLEQMETDCDGKDKKMTSTEKTVGEDDALGENRSKDEKIQKDELANPVCESLAAPDTKPEADLETDIKEALAAETVTEMAEEANSVNASKAGHNTSAVEETKPASFDGKAGSQDTVMPALPKVTQEMVNALLVECRTRTANHSNNTATPTNGEQGQKQTETEQGKVAEETKKPTKNHTEEEVKRQERERKESEARKEKEARERRAKKERDDRVRREKREEERREWERRDRERKERKRAYGEGLSGFRSSSRYEGYRQSSWRDEECHNSRAETKTVEEEEGFDEFPFNMSDFVTVDEVGDVTDLPCPPSPTVPMDTTEGGEDAPTSVQEDAPAVATETSVSDTTAALVKCDEQLPESEPVTALTAETSDTSVSSVLTPGPVLNAAAPPSPASQSDSSHSQTHAPARQPEEPELTPDTETTLTATLDTTTEAETLPSSTPAASAPPAGSSSDSPVTGAVTAESEEGDKEDNAFNHSEAKAEETAVALDKTEEREEKQDEENKETGAPAVTTGKDKRSEDQTNAQEESVEKKLKTETVMSTGGALPPYNPSKPVAGTLAIVESSTPLKAESKPKQDILPTLVMSGGGFRRCVFPCPRYITAGDTHEMCVSCLGLPHAQAALERAACDHCEAMPLRVLRSRAALFSADGRMRSSRGSGPAVAEASRRLQSWGSQCNQGSEDVGTAEALSRSSFAGPHPSSSRPGARVLDSPVGESSPSAAPPSDSEELDVVSFVEDFRERSQRHQSAPSYDELLEVVTRAVATLHIDWPQVAQEPRARSKLDERFLPHHAPPRRRPLPFFPDLHNELCKSWGKPFSARLSTSSLQDYSNVAGTKELGYGTMPPVEEALASYLSPSLASSLKRPALPSRPCRATSEMVGKAYVAVSQAGASLHTIAVLQAYQAELLRDFDFGGGPSEEGVSELRRATDLALRVTKETARSVGRSMAALVATERHLWLNLSGIRRKEKAFLLDAPLCTSGLFGEAVDTVVSRFQDAKTQGEAFQRYIPRRSGPGTTTAQEQRSQPSTSSSCQSQKQSVASRDPPQHTRDARRRPRPQPPAKADLRIQSQWTQGKRS